VRVCAMLFASTSARVFVRGREYIVGRSVCEDTPMATATATTMINTDSIYIMSTTVIRCDDIAVVSVTG